MSEIAIDLVEAEAEIEVTTSFDEGEMIPIEHAAEGHNASLALNWSGAPDATRSVVVISDDPDATEPRQFVAGAQRNAAGQE